MKLTSGHGGEGALKAVHGLMEHLNYGFFKIAERGQNGRTIPTRGIIVMIQPRTEVLRSSADIGGTTCEAGKVFTACRIRNMQTAQFEIHRE